jgi:hypothetical protein
MSVSPPAGGLGSNSNYILTSQCDNITGLTVTINVTQKLFHTPHSHWIDNDLIHKSGDGIAPAPYLTDAFAFGIGVRIPTTFSSTNK